MDMIAVKSSNLESVGYDKDNRVLVVQFKGKEYSVKYYYAKVPPVVYRELLKAESKGGFIYENVKGYFEILQRVKV